ncbi:hypothetical protein Isop_1985 [Isosphaera pallida ATCC 43644]|uniref:Peptidase C1A papain n=1 Tax=Isosphaera pallida (strain ATCC 43644 / DSM 9630 / IS1B) TaxID=575540 RepID=E8R346_ISOPI|nr:hypothetical protein [Isosphaera pallida]ADV62565.1 hypothetical protein Isop_1985 [Isosphaera pallida ATCC 43644]
MTDPSMAGLTGWRPDPAESRRIAALQPRPRWETSTVSPDDAAGEVALWHRVFERATGSPCLLPDRQGVGDCVGWAFGLAVSLLNATSHPDHDQERPTGWPWVATEPIYAGARVQVGGGRLGLHEDGATGAWAAHWLTQWGVLWRTDHGSSASSDLDLTRYDPRRARRWGVAGTPRSLEALARQRPTRVVTQIGTYTEARAALARGYPIVVCSDVGFRDRRDRDGFAPPQGRWMHAMCLIGLDDDAIRPGALCQNSWGPDWISGPTRHEQPPGSFWIDANVVQRMLVQGDSWAVGDLEGFPHRPVNHRLI